MPPVVTNRTEIPDILNNPYIGWVPWAEWGPYPQPHRLVYGPMLWSELEPTKNNYAWSAIETKLKFSYWAGKKVKFVLRVIMDLTNGSSHKDIPEWLYQEINKEGTWYGHGFSPNYKNTALISNHKRLITALGQRYNNDPRIAFIEIGSIGHWGEFHTYYVKPQEQGYMPPISISDQYVQHYISAFTNKHLLMRRPFQIAKDNKLGLFNDMFGNVSETTRFLRYVNNGYTSSGDYGSAAGTYPAMPNFWMFAPSGGEFGDCPGLQYLSDSSIQQTIQFAVDSHTSWLGPCSPANQAVGSTYQANMDALRKKMGYRFIIETESHNDTVNTGSVLNVTMQLNNKGVAPFYYKWPFELSLSDSAGGIAAKVNTTEDIRTWLPGTRTITVPFSIPGNLAAGTYTLCAAIIDPETGTPGVDFAMTGRRTDGRYSLGKVTVTAGASGIIIDGNTSDWNNIAAVAEASSANTLKVTNDRTKLYLLVQGTGLNVKSSFYINSDNNSNTGYKVPGWSTSGCEYLLENNILYRYTGDGTTWAWSSAGTMEFVKTNTVIEAAILLTAMNLAVGNTIQLGYVMSDSATKRLPAAGGPLAAYTLK